MEQQPKHIALSTILDFYDFEFSGDIAMPLRSPMYCHGFIASFIHHKIPKENSKVVPFELLEWMTDEDLLLFAKLYHDRVFGA